MSHHEKAASDLQALEASSQELPEKFRAAMRMTASGVAILTTDGVAGKGGATVSSFTSLSFDPPSVLVCLNRSGLTLARLIENGVFAANILSEDQSEVAHIFATSAMPIEDRFLHGGWRGLKTGAPLLDGALAQFDCTLSARFDYGTHTIIIGDAVGIVLNEALPLAYSRQAYHRLHRP